MEDREIIKIHVGTSGYAYKEWKGKFYPEKISPKAMLRFYSGRLNTVEINNTFYRMPKESVLTSWAEQVPGDFVFAVKAPQVITHLKRLWAPAPAEPCTRPPSLTSSSWWTRLLTCSLPDRT